MVKGLRTNLSLVSIDLGSNDVTGPGSAALFKQLGRNEHIVSLNLANTDKLHRNRMGAKACVELGAMLQKNQVLALLNIATTELETKVFALSQMG